MTQRDEPYPPAPFLADANFGQTLLDAIPAPIFFKDRKGLYLGCNTAFERFIGQPRQQIVGGSVWDVAPGQLADIYHQQDMALLADPGVQVYETTVEAAGGRRRTVIFHKAVFYDQKGRPAGLIGVILDVTELRQAERQLRETRDQLEERVRERTAELAAKNRELQQEVSRRASAETALRESAEKFKLFAYSIVHDLKSPTIGLHGLAKSLGAKYRDQLDDRGRAYLDQIQRAAEKSHTLVDEINHYIVAQEAPLKVEAIVVGELLAELGQLYRDTFAEKQLRWHASEIDVICRADRIGLTRVLVNLIDNALKYGGRDMGRVEIDCHDVGPDVLFEVFNDGRPLDLGPDDDLFQPFRRKTTSGGVEGSGLGLAIVREIVESHGGTVWVESSAQEGTRFFFTIKKGI